MGKGIRHHVGVWGTVVVLAGGALGLGPFPGVAEALDLFVANNGEDSAACGPELSPPCRSISQAIANAVAGDRIVVRPGRYGDLDRDGNFTLPGEEAAEEGVGCNCMIKVNKDVTIESSKGADATVLDAGGANVSVVRIQTSGVTFGNKKRGFTLIDGTSGLVVDAGTSGVRVNSNVSKLHATHGFVLDGSQNSLSRNLATSNPGNGYNVSGTANRLSSNLAVENNGAGFLVQGTGQVVSHNGANNGGGVGFFFGGTDHQVLGNTAGASGAGFQFEGTGHLARGNVASGNMSHGFDVFGPGGGGHVLQANAARGNIGAGLNVQFVGGGLTVSGNNFFGNDPANNCGLRNDSGGAVIATNNFWGAAAGPGADPADQVCNVGGGSTTTSAPAAATEFNVPTFPVF